MRAAPRQGTVLAAATAAQAAVSFLTFGLPSIGPEIQRELSLTLPQLGAILSASLLGAGLSLIGAGLAVARFGTRAALAGGVALGVAGLVGAAAAGSFGVVWAFLLASGVGASVVPIGGAGALFHAYAPERRAWALGVRQTAVPAGGVLGAALIPAIDHAGGLDAVFLAAAGLMGATGAAFALVAPPDRAPVGRDLGFRAIRRAPGMGRLLLVSTCYIVVLTAALTYCVPAARDAGASAFAAGAAFVVLNLAAAVSRIVWGRVADRDAGTRRVRTLVEVGVVAAAGATAFALALHAGTPAVFASVVLLGVGAFGWNALVYVTAGERVPLAVASQSVAVAATVVFVGGAVSAAPLGALADGLGWDALWLTTSALALAGAGLAAGLDRRPEDASAAE